MADALLYTVREATDEDSDDAEERSTAWEVEHATLHDFTSVVDQYVIWER